MALPEQFMYKIQEWTKFTLKKKSILHMYVYCILGLMEKIRLRENASLMLYNQGIHTEG